MNEDEHKSLREFIEKHCVTSPGLFMQGSGRALRRTAGPHPAVQIEAEAPPERKPEPAELTDRLTGGLMESGISAMALKDILISKMKNGEVCPCTKCDRERQVWLGELNQQIDFDSCWYRDGYERVQEGTRRVMTPFGWLEFGP